MSRNGARFIAGFVGVAAISLIAWTSIATGDEPVARDATALRGQDFESSTISQDGYTLDVSSLTWAMPASDYDPAILSVSEGQDSRLKKCGSESWEDSILVLAPADRAYCIAPVDTKDPDLMAAVRIAATKLIKGGEWTDAELNYLRLQVLASFASDTGSPDAPQLWEEFKEAGDALTPEERRHVSE